MRAMVRGPGVKRARARCCAPFTRKKSSYQTPPDADHSDLPIHARRREPAPAPSSRASLGAVPGDPGTSPDPAVLSCSRRLLLIVRRFATYYTSVHLHGFSKRKHETVRQSRPLLNRTTNRCPPLASPPLRNFPRCCYSYLAINRYYS